MQKLCSTVMKIAQTIPILKVDLNNFFRFWGEMRRVHVFVRFARSGLQLAVHYQDHCGSSLFTQQYLTFVTTSAATAAAK